MIRRPGDRRVNGSLEERFWPKVNKRGADECWLWTAQTSSDGYGQVRDGDGRKVAAHRASWFLAYGPIPGGLCVLHRCDNPPCVNPSHLFLGTRADNMADMVAKGRHRSPDQKGEANGQAKLTEDDVVAIYADPRFHRLIAIDYGVARPTVSMIKHGKGWRWLTCDLAS